MSEPRGQKRTKYLKDNPEAVARRNRIRGIQEEMVGGRATLYALSPEVRSWYRELSTKLYDAGTTAGKAEEFMKKSTEGFVYVISHPNFPSYVKIGRACDPIARLANYQTGCPMRAYKLEGATFFTNCHHTERKAHDVLDSCRMNGEWFCITAEEALKTINQLGE